MEQPKFCTDCKYFRPNTAWVPDHPERVRHADCGHLAPTDDPDRFISPQFWESTQMRRCSARRMLDTECGPAANWFEPKEAES